MMELPDDISKTPEGVRPDGMPDIPDFLDRRKPAQATMPGHELRPGVPDADSDPGLRVPGDRDPELPQMNGGTVDVAEVVDPACGSDTEPPFNPFKEGWK